MKYLIILLSFIVPSFSYSLDADYNGGEELILIERMPLNPEDKTYNNKYPNTIPLGSIYWDSNNIQYYYVKDGSRLTKTNGLTYKLDPKKEQESSFIGEPQDTQLLYAGYISSNQRLYINPKTQEQFIKTLEPITDREPLQPKIFTNQSEISILYYGFGNRMGSFRHSTNGLWDLNNYQDE